MVAHRRDDKANPAVQQRRSDLPPERFARDHRDQRDEGDEVERDEEERDFQHDLRDLVDTLERMAKSDLCQRIDKCAADTSRHLADLRKSPPPTPPTPAADSRQRIHR